ncbi:MAG TPA: N-acetylglucosamine-6-phosphate deacetylase, partial [Actinomycetota bacterium]|nr:N-acetylglucosamine-6-phosphate deacetylase [Actinomycetota bacterium]
AVPGYVDLQVNGFAGVDFLSADAEGYREAGLAIAATGVTAYQPTFITSPLEAYWPALDTVAGVDDTGGPRLLGVHLEGPFISPSWPGAHRAGHILEPDLAIADRLCAAGPVTFMTVAPEQPGGLKLVTHLVEKGLVVACGHTDSDSDVARRAFDAGARALTHIYNAQRRWKPRDPGIAGVALTRPDIVVQAIVDHVHLAPETAYATFLATRGRFCLVTDAMAATALGDGIYSLGDREVSVTGTEARLADGTLAGSVLTMDQAVQNLVGLGASIEDAVDAATRVPAQLVGKHDLGFLTEGGTADLVVLDEALMVERTLVGGTEVFARAS